MTPSPSDEKSYAPSGFSAQSPTRSNSFSDKNSTHEVRNEVECQGPKLPFGKGRAIALVVTLTGAAFLNILSIQSTIIILPSIGRDLDIPSSRLQWVVSSYSLTFGCFLLLWGRIADIYGKRIIFILGSLWAAIFAAINPFVPNEIVFNIFRGLHGLGAAANVPTAIGILGVTFPPGKAKTYAFTAYAAGGPLGSICGNFLSGIISQYANWRWVFGVCSIATGLVAIAGYMLIPKNSIQARPAGKRGKVDWIGGALITIGLIALMFSLTEGNVVGWTTPWIPVILIASFLIIGTFVLWQIRLERQPTGIPPLVRMSIFKNPRFSAAMVIMMLFFASFNNFLIFATIYFQDYQGLSALQTMFRFIPTGVGGILVSFCIAYVITRVPTFFINLVGNCSIAISCLLFAVPIPPSTSYFAFGFIAMCLSVIGADTTWPCLTLFTSQALPAEDQAVGGALINAASQFGRAIGLAVSTAVSTAVIAQHRNLSVSDAGPIIEGDDASLAGIRAANWTNFGFAILSIAVIVTFFRSMEIIGKPQPTASSPGERALKRADSGNESAASV